ncbi:MAG: GNAT family N-acetyltransferase [Alphaproteobacteria bacterium]|nr:GNAT family N-acetyltransferase [Alphaproteobacteria bacterium]
MTEVSLETLSGAAIAAVVEDLAQLRVRVFRDWPYLYEGSIEYERKYLVKYAGIETATVVVARADSTIVGASTALPLLRAEEELQAPFRRTGLDPAEFYYYGESVLLPEWRGRGTGVAFFTARETRARALGFRFGTFCGVVRAADHPARPAGYVPLDGFWGHRGYAKLPGVTASFSWRDVGDTEATSKPMEFWSKRL